MSLDNTYTTYNARHYNPEQVAEKFIWSDSFGELIQNDHSIILGARGCGKTTLMKMLTIPALHSWKSDKRAIKIKKEIPFYAVYISTDIYWDVKYQTYGDQLKEYGSFSEIISHFSVNSNIFNSLCDTFFSIINLELKDSDEEKEIELCTHLIKAWKLKPTIPKIVYIKEALNERIDHVNQLIQEIIFNYSPDSKLPHPAFFNLNFESSLEELIPKFERIYNISNNKKKKKWALCFDELEFAPNWLKDKLFTSLRSRKQYIIYKLSSSPILPSELKKVLSNEYSASSGNDVHLIKMWTTNNEEFSRKIIQSFFTDDASINSFFGTNELYNNKADSYKLESDFYYQILSLINKDKSFRNFLLNKGIDIEKPDLTNKKNQNVLYRKIKPIVYFRNFFIEKNDGIKVELRSRKKAIDLYSGIEVLCKVCDGNPRWLIGIVSQIINRNKNTNKVSKGIQYDELLSAAKRFKNVISNIPVGNNISDITEIIERSGLYFKEQILGNQFRMDPDGTFKVDIEEDKINTSLVDLIEKGVYQGAFILVGSGNDSYDFQIRGQRFKISYLFFILYNLPLRNYSEAKLSNCLKEYTGDIELNQTSLFN
jgi:energy-coupling factor transporter ATP-binding protein EcfA2